MFTSYPVYKCTFMSHPMYKCTFMYILEVTLKCMHKQPHLSSVIVAIVHEMLIMMSVNDGH